MLPLKEILNKDINLICCLRQERGNDLFKDYVNNLYQIITNTINPIETNIAKLKLNYLYGLPSAEYESNKRYYSNKNNE
jgi:hypothetical protein